MMPVMSGDEMVNLIQGNAGQADTPIIMLGNIKHEISNFLK